MKSEFPKSDIAPFWAEYAPLRDSAEWHRLKYARAFEIAHATRRFLPNHRSKLAEIPTVAELEALVSLGERDPSTRKGGHVKAVDATADGFGYAREYLAAIRQIAVQAHAGDVDRVHDAICRGLGAVPIAGLGDVRGAAASAMLGLVNGGTIATSSAMRTVQRYVRAFRET